MDAKLLLLLIAGTALLVAAQDDNAAAEGENAPAEGAGAADEGAGDEGAAAAVTEAPVVDESASNVTTKSPNGTVTTEAPAKASNLGFSAAVTVVTVTLAFYL